MARISADDLKVPVGIGWAPTLAVLAAGILPALYGAYWAIPLTAGTVSAAIGVWRAVRILGMMLDHLHWRDLEVPAGESPTALPAGTARCPATTASTAGGRADPWTSSPSAAGHPLVKWMATGPDGVANSVLDRARDGSAFGLPAGCAPVCGVQRADMVDRTKLVQAAGEKVRACPAGSLLSRTATRPGRLSATSTHAPPLSPLRVLLRHCAQNRSSAMMDLFLDVGGDPSRLFLIKREAE